MLRLALLLGCWFVPASAWAHARFKLGSLVTPPRSDATGLKTPPCGGVARTANVGQFKPGQKITVEFEETIQHISYFILAFSPNNDRRFANNVLVPRIADNQSGSNDLPHQYTATITLPNIKCNNCALQLIQVMKDGTTGLMGAETGRYYSCTDIQLVDNPVPRQTPFSTPVSSPEASPQATPSSIPSEQPSGSPAPQASATPYPTVPGAPTKLKIQRLDQGD